MKRVKVATDKSYEVVIGTGILNKSGELVREVCSSKKIAVVTDDIVNELYADTLISSLEKENYEVVKFVFPNGEESKNIITYSNMLEFMAENKLTRSDCIVALGGGVVGDMAGFCAATYLRGIDFIQIPTTLLALVDSSVGGKTAIDLKAGKNLAGAFYQPSLVIADCETLSTLKESTFSDGMAEVIKYGILFDGEFFDFLNENEAKDNLEYIVEKCVCFKRDIVSVDEKEKGSRALLNLGHTLAHAIEKCSDYKTEHGKAVAVGTVIISLGAYKLGLTQNDITDRVININKKYNLPVSTEYSASELLEVTKQDKKCDADKITLVIPEKIGKCKLYKTDFNTLKSVIEKGLN